MRSLFWILIATVFAGPISAGIPVPVPTVLQGNQVIGNVVLAGGYEAELVITFERPTALAFDALDITATLLTLPDTSLQTRLPQGVQIPSEFPVLIQIARAGASSFTFGGLWELEIHTYNLSYEPHTALRLFKAPDGGTFQDISLTMGQGSYRVRGSGGQFSEFLIASDLRPLSIVAEQKMNRLDNLLVLHEPDIETNTLASLQSLAGDIRTKLEASNIGGAKIDIDLFLDEVLANEGANIPDRWDPDPGLPLVSISGRLRAAARSLRLTLAQIQTPRDVGTAGLTKRLTPGGGLYRLSVHLTFPDQTDLDLDLIDIQAQVIDPLDEAILGRLPGGGANVAIPPDFPVLITIQPMGSAEGFRGAWEIEVDTPDLAFTADRPLRLFKAPDGGTFRDISSTMGIGSYRVRGSGGQFSEFLIVEDLRPENAVTQGKFDGVNSILNNSQGDIAAELYANLTLILGDSETAWSQGLFKQAISDMEAFLDIVEGARGDELPGLWVTDGSVINVTGRLLGGARSLRLQLVLAKSPLTAVDRNDIDGNGVVDILDVYRLIEIVFPSTPPTAEPIGPRSRNQQDR